ncbi:MAG: hypothetical protein WCQ47_08385, partial [bacterium]
VERPIYNINTTNIFASTSLVYDANNDFEMLEVNSEDNTKNTNVDLVKEESPKVTLADALTDSKVSSNIVGAYRSSPETFSKENIIEFINSAFLQKNRSQQIDILNKASFIVNQLSKYSTNLVPLRQSITEAEEKISKNDFEFFKSKLEQCLNSKFDNNITDEQVINKAADFILANDGRLSGAQSELMKSMVFGELSRDFHDGLLTQLDKQISFGSYDNKKDLEKKESLMFFLLIANNASLPEIKGILLDAVFAKNEFVKNIIDISKSNIDAVDLGLDKNIKDKVLEKLDEITKSIELGRKI